jgi:hypothetical protein
MKLREIRCHFQEVSHRRTRRSQRLFKILLFNCHRTPSAFSAHSAVNYYVSFSIRLAAFQAGGSADPPATENP